MRGRKEIVEVLLRVGANVDKPGSGGRTACHAAVEHGNLVVLALLLAHGPNLALKAGYKIHDISSSCLSLTIEFAQTETGHVVAIGELPIKSNHVALADRRPIAATHIVEQTQDPTQSRSQRHQCVRAPSAMRRRPRAHRRTARQTDSRLAITGECAWSSARWPYTISESRHHTQTMPLFAESFIVCLSRRMSSLLAEFANAIERNNVSRIESLLKNGSIDVNARLPRKKNPPALVVAARLGRKDVVDVLLRFGARIDDAGDDGRTACHVAATGQADVLALLLAHQPNLGLRCKSGQTPLNRSLMFHDGERDRIAMMLIDAGAPHDQFDRQNLCPLAVQSTSAIQTLLRHGVVVGELRDQQGRSPLHLAASAGASAAVLDMLVNECGVDLEARNTWDNTCTHIAHMSKNADAIRYFIAAGAKLEAVNSSMRTPLHMASDEKCTIVLLAAGADVHARDELGRTTCMEQVTALTHHPVAVVRSIVNVMLAAGADLDVADRNGETARQLLAHRQLTFEGDGSEVENARREIAEVRLDFVRHRAWQVCIGLQSRSLDALQMCELLLFACGPVAPLIPFHQWWKIATTVKHFKSSQ